MWWIQTEHIDYKEVTVKHIFYCLFFSSIKDLKDKKMVELSSFNFLFFLWAEQFLPSTGTEMSGWSCGWQFLLEMNGKALVTLNFNGAHACVCVYMCLCVLACPCNGLLMRRLFICSPRTQEIELLTLQEQGREETMVQNRCSIDRGP